MNYDHLSMAFGTLPGTNLNSYADLSAYSGRQQQPSDSIVLDVTQDNQTPSLNNLVTHTEGNQNLLDNRNANDQQTTRPERLPSLKWILFNKNFRLQEHWSSEDVAREILIFVAEIYLYLSIIYLLGAIILKGYISFYSLFSFSIVGCFSKIIRTYRSTCEEGPVFSRDSRYKIFDILHWTIVSAFIAAAGIRLSPVQAILTPYAVGGALNQIVSHFCANHPHSIIHKNVITCTNLFFWMQIALIALKADGIIQSWWLVFGVLFYALVASAIVSPVLIIGIMYLYRRADLDRYTWNFKSRTWYISNVCLIGISALVLLGLIEVFKGNDWNTFLIFIVAIAAAHAITMTAITLVYSEQIVIHLTYVVEQIFDDLEIAPETQIFETIKAKFQYLLRISPTYYAVVDKDFKTKDKQVSVGHKDQINEVKLLKRRSKDTTKLATFDTQFKDLKVDIKSATVLKSKKANKSNANTGLELVCEKQISSPMLKAQKPYLCYSDDDAEIADEVQQKKKGEGEDHSCTICCMNKPNAVFMDCGHGGVCYGCAMESWKKGDKCIFCRQPVNEILKVNVLDGVNIAKVVEGTKKNVASHVWDIEAL